MLIAALPQPRRTWPPTLDAPITPEIQALAHRVQGDIPAALVPLSHALRLAEPEDYVRIFADEAYQWRPCWKRP